MPGAVQEETQNSEEGSDEEDAGNDPGGKIKENPDASRKEYDEKKE